MNSKLANILKKPTTTTTSHRILPKLWSRLSTAVQTSPDYENRNILQLKDRNLIASIFPNKQDQFEKFISSAKHACYCGFDPTASSLHIGNLLALITLMHCQRRGHTPIVVIGSATALIGDPSDKTSDRKTLDADVIASNSAKIEASVSNIFKNHENLIWKRTHKAALPELKIFNNIKWYEDMNVIKFMSLYGKQLRMGDLMSRKQMIQRLNSKEGINYAEFSYQAFQAYDWFYLLQNHNCTIQIGGNDQTGNLKTGHELISKLRWGANNSGKKPVFSLTFPIVTSEKGDKLGKSVGNATWLDPSLLSSFEFYQFFVNTSDQMVNTYLKMFTFLPLNEIDDIMRKHQISPENYHAQRKLASELTLLVHGEAGLESALKCTNAVYFNDREALSRMTQTEIDACFKGCSSVTLTMDPSMTVTECVLKANCFRNIDDAAHIIRSGGVRFNSNLCTNPQDVLIYGQHILSNNITIIRIGKKNAYLIKWVP